jgi:hypothetical protein
MKKYIFGITIIIFTLFISSSVFADESYHYDYHRILKHGSGGNDVVMAKFCLSTIQNDYYDVHGYFDSATKARVISFQTANKLSADGVIGPVTGAAMAMQCNAIYDAVSNTEIKPTANVDFGFSLRNTYSKKIMIDGLESLIFEIDGEKINGNDLNKMAGYSVTATANGKKLSSNKSYGLAIDGKTQFIIHVALDANKTSAGTGTYQITLREFHYEYNGKTQKPVALNFESNSLYLRG